MNQEDSEPDNKKQLWEPSDTIRDPAFSQKLSKFESEIRRSPGPAKQHWRSTYGPGWSPDQGSEPAATEQKPVDTNSKPTNVPRPSDSGSSSGTIAAQVSNAQQFWISVQKWAGVTTFHGIRNAFDTKYDVRRRAIWILMILTVIAILIWFAQDQAKRYFEYRTLTARTTYPAPAMPFSAVTICSLNHIRNDSVVITKERELLTLLQKHNTTKTMLLNQFAEDFLRNISLKDIYRDGAMQPEVMLKGCFWDSEPLDCMDMFNFRATDHGYCYTFNRKNLGEKFDKRFVTQIPGSRYGLELYLWVEKDNYYIMDDHSAGFKLQVHEIYDEPDMSTAHALSPGFFYSVSMNRHEYKSLTGINCVETLKKDIKAVDYDPLHCALICRAQYVYQICGCVGPFDRENLTVCDPIQLVDCYRPAISSFTLVGHQCNCPAACHVLTFDTRLSSAYLIENVLGDNNDPTWRENVVVLKVFFDTMVVTLDEQMFAFTAGDFWASFGGYVGLATGCSILTFVEIGELFVVRAVAIIKKWRGKRPRDGSV